MRTIGTLIVAVLILTTTQSLRAQQSDLSPVRIEVPGSNNLQFLTLWTALGSHYFEREGLEPEILIAPTPRQVGQALLEDRADVALLPPPMFLGMIAQERPIVLFASLLANEPINLVVRSEVADALSLDAHSDLVQRLRTLQGARIGLAEEVLPRLQPLLGVAGLNAERDFELVSLPGPRQVQAFVDGTVDALFAHTPYLETALTEHGGILVANASSGSIPVLADGQVHALATSRARAENNPELVGAVTRAIYRALLLLHSDQAAAVDAILASGTTRADRAMVDAIVAIYAPAVPETPEISLEGIVRDVELFPAHPRAPDFTLIDINDFVAPDFALQALSTDR